MKIATSSIPAPQLPAGGGIRSLATAMALAALMATSGEGVNAKIFTSPCDKDICGNKTIVEYQSLETSKGLPTKQVKEALANYDGVVIIGTPEAVVLLLAELGDCTELMQEGEFSFDAQLVAITLIDVG